LILTGGSIGMAALAGHVADHRAVLRSAVWSRAAAPAVRSSTGALRAGQTLGR
jgi:hypothetical protein